LNTEISQGSAATQLRCDGMFNNDYCKFTSESASERILIIVSMWPSYGQKSSVLYFFGSV